MDRDAFGPVRGRRFIGCDCPPGEFTVTALASADDVYYEVAGAGDSEQAAVDDANRHAFAVLGDDAVIHGEKPA